MESARKISGTVNYVRMQKSKHYYVMVIDYKTANKSLEIRLQEEKFSV